MRPLIVLALSAALGATAQGQAIYRCQEDGKTVFSGTPCAPDAQAVRVRSGHEPTQAELDAARAQSEAVDAEIAQRLQQEKIRRLEWERDAEIARIERGRKTANNNLAGATYLQSLAEQEQAALARHDALINDARRQLPAATNPPIPSP